MKGVKSEDLLLFNIDPKFRDDFVNCNISAELKRIFKDNGIMLSDNASILIEAEDRWLINDKDIRYSIKEEGGKLGIYKVPLALILSENLRFLIDQSEFTMIDVEGITGISKREIGKISREQANITLETLEKLLRVWSFSDLFGINMGRIDIETKSQMRDLSVNLDKASSLLDHFSKQIEILNRRESQASGVDIDGVIETISIAAEKDPNLNNVKQILRLPAIMRNVTKVPAQILLPLKVTGDKIINRYTGEEVVTSEQVSDLLHNFYSLRSKAQDKICENMKHAHLLDNLGDSVLITAGESHVFRRLMDYMHDNKMDPLIGISIGLYGEIQREGTDTWLAARQMKNPLKADLLQPKTNQGSYVGHEIEQFVRDSKRKKVIAVFGFECCIANGDDKGIISSSEFLNIIKFLREMEGNKHIDKLTVCFIGESFKVIQKNINIAFNMNERYIRIIPFSKDVDHIITDHKCHNRDDTSNIKCCIEYWKNVFNKKQKELNET